MGEKLVTVIGGSGFLGRYVVRELARAGWRIRVVCRNPYAADFLRPMGEVGQIVVVYGDLARAEGILPYVFETDALVNLVGILYEKGRQRFDTLHTIGVEKLARAARMARLSTMVHVSSLGVNRAIASHYASTKFRGEQGLRAAFPEGIILRPGVMFGAEDGFLNRFGEMAMVSPFLPLIGGGQARFQPVYVADVARAVRICLETPAAFGKLFELGGPQVYTLKQIMDYIVSQTHRHCRLVNIPPRLANAMAFFAEFLPRPPLTRDQVRLLGYDNTVDASALTLSSLGITPTAMEQIAPGVLARYGRAPVIS